MLGMCRVCVQKVYGKQMVDLWSKIQDMLGQDWDAASDASFSSSDPPDEAEGEEEEEEDDAEVDEHEAKRWVRSAHLAG